MPQSKQNPLIHGNNYHTHPFLELMARWVLESEEARLEQDGDALMEKKRHTQIETQQNKE